MPSSVCIRMTIRTGYFFNVDSLLFLPFSEPVMLWSLVTITSSKQDHTICPYSLRLRGMTGS